jgi:type II protein arginine methyltransferase
MSAGELSEHAGYLADAVKMAAYQEAFASVVDESSVVVDLGAGSGILGLLAAGAGARKVYAIDSGPIIGPAADVVASSPFRDRFVHLRARSTDVTLPELADVVVCDQIGGFVYDAGVLEFFADARARLMAPDAVCVPAAFDLVMAPARCDPIRRQIDLWGARPQDIDFEPFRQLAVNTEHHVDGSDVRVLAMGAIGASVQADDASPFIGRSHCVVDRPGRMDGVAGWFRAHLGGGVEMTNDPDAADRMDRWVNVYPIDAPVQLQVGDEVTVEIDVRPATYVATWRVRVHRGDTELLSERRSTLLGVFLSPTELGHP